MSKVSSREENQMQEDITKYVSMVTLVGIDDTMARLATELAIRKFIHSIELYERLNEDEKHLLNKIRDYGIWSLCKRGGYRLGDRILIRKIINRAYSSGDRKNVEEILSIKVEDIDKPSKYKSSDKYNEEAKLILNYNTIMNNKEPWLALLTVIIERNDMQLTCAAVYGMAWYFGKMIEETLVKWRLLYALSILRKNSIVLGNQTEKYEEAYRWFKNIAPEAIEALSTGYGIKEIQQVWTYMKMYKGSDELNKLIKERYGVFALQRYMKNESKALTFGSVARVGFEAVYNEAAYKISDEAIKRVNRLV